MVAGFVNSAAMVQKFGDLSKVTSLSLRSLCKTVLQDTNPNTSTASERCKVAYQQQTGSVSFSANLQNLHMSGTY